MTSIFLHAAADKENVCRMPGKAKSFAGARPSHTGGVKVFAVFPLGGVKVFAVTPQKVFQKQVQAVLPSVATPVAVRTFGDISNKLDSRVDLTPASANKQKSAQLKLNFEAKLKHQSPKIAVTTKAVNKVEVEPEVYEQDFFPIIQEIEDYSDILPPSLVLQPHHINRLVRSWEVLQRPAMHPFDLLPSPPSSPTRDSSLLVLQSLPCAALPPPPFLLLQDTGILDLEPVDEMLEVPPLSPPPSPCCRFTLSSLE